jgi:hypothetical protein
MARTSMRLRLTVVALLLWLVQPLTAVAQETDTTLAGEFAVTIASEDVPPELVDGASLIGRWRITFTEDGAYLLGRQDVGPLVNGRFEIDGNRLTLDEETGVLSCSSGEDGNVTANYEWHLTGDRLQLVAIEEPCAWRRLLLTTRTLSIFAACPPPQTVSLTSAVGTPTGEALGASKEDAVSMIVATQESLNPAIDTVLRQMSDCWATRTPDRFLNLLSQEFRASQQPDDSDDQLRFTLAMGAPIVWERVGDVDLVDATHATASVRQISGDAIDVVRYGFVFEDGAWRWDGTADNP